VGYPDAYLGHARLADTLNPHAGILAAGRRVRAADDLPFAGLVYERSPT
jgi:hypothetical protein